MDCPIHKTNMPFTDTRFGKRFACSQCDMVSWNGNSPASQKTREARIGAHRAFDAIWKAGCMGRTAAYSALATYMGKSKKRTHIAQFSNDECQRVIEFTKELLNG